MKIKLMNLLRVLKQWLHNSLIAFDQLINAVFFLGHPDETLSSRSYRLYRDGVSKIPCILIDTLFFWDREDGNKHCELSYISEQERMQLPPEFRAYLQSART